MFLDLPSNVIIIKASLVLFEFNGFNFISMKFTMKHLQYENLLY